MSENSIDLTLEEVRLRLDVQVGGMNVQPQEEIIFAVDLQPDATPVLELVKTVNELDIQPECTPINQYYSGEGAASDGTTITGDGTSGDPLSVISAIADGALNAFQVPLLFSEIQTQTERLDAQQNLGLHIIDGGTFN